MNTVATASAPATTANLGPAFDCIAMALSPRCLVRARPSSKWMVEHNGEHQVSSGEADGVVAAAQRAVGDRPLALEVAQSG